MNAFSVEYVDIYSLKSIKIDMTVIFLMCVILMEKVDIHYPKTIKIDVSVIMYNLYWG